MFKKKINITLIPQEKDTKSVIMSAKKLYVIANSHMDPIWLWRLREGRSTWLNTCRSVVRMLKKYPFLKFCRSSSSCYEWLEACDPALFAEIRELVDAGRWEPVGGWIEQSDTIITPGEVLFRQAEFGKRYFREKFGKEVRIGYSVDAFGQNAGLPKILKTTGFDRYVFMRPMAEEKTMPYLFRWRGDDGSEVLTLRIRLAYCTLPGWQKKQELFDWIDQLFAEGDEHQTFFFGVGDHGGGIYEKQLNWLLEAAETRAIEFSTLEHYFDVIETLDLPVCEGELTHHSPGCYAAVSTIKRQLASAERTLFKAEKLVLESPGPDAAADTKKLDDAWNQLLFNYFHDIYPGTAVKRAFDGEVRDLTGYARWIASSILEKRLGRYAAQAKSDFLSEGGVLLWNPLPVPVRAVFGFDTFSDPNCNGKNFNALRDCDGNVIPLQFLRPATSYGPNNAWGRATAVVDLPPSGLRTFAYTYEKTSAATLGFERQQTAFRRITFPIITDVGDTWGHGLARLGETAGEAEFVGFEEIDNGPAASCLRGRYRWKDSEFKLDLFAYAGIPELFARWNAEWREKDDTVKLSWRTGIEGGEFLTGQAAALLARTPDGFEQPFIDFVAAAGNDGKTSGILAEALHSYDSFGSGELRLTLLRPVCYAEHLPHRPHGDEGYADLGEAEQEFWISDGRPAAELPATARERLWGAEHLEITAASDGTKLRRTVWSIEPPSAVALCQNDREIRLWNSSTASSRIRICRDGVEIASRLLAPAAVRAFPLD